MVFTLNQFIGRGVFRDRDRDRDRDRERKDFVKKKAVLYRNSEYISPFGS